MTAHARGAAARDAPARGLWRRSLGVRLAAGYAVVFLLSTAVLFALAYVLLARSLRARDRAAILTEAAEVRADFGANGRDAIEEEIAEMEINPALAPVLFRIVDETGRQRLVPAPRWAPFERPPPDARAETWSRAPALGGGAGLDVFTIVLRDSSGPITFQVAGPSAGRAEVLERFRELFLLILVPVLLAALGGGLLFARRALAPVRDLAVTAQRVAATGQLGERVPTSGSGDELDDLAQLVNRMLARVEALVDGMRATLDDAAHDLRTPLTRLRAGAERALLDGPEAHADALSDAVEETDSVLAILDAVMDVAEAEAGTLALRRAPTDLAALVAQVVDVYGLVAEEKGVALLWEPPEASTPEALVASVDAARVRQAVANLVDNALKYTPLAGTVRVSLAPEAGDPPGAVITVEDDGPGIAAGDRPRIWDRLFRGDASRSERGLGLGLSVVRAVAEAHGGSAEMEPASGGGSRFRLRLPLGAEASG